MRKKSIGFGVFLLCIGIIWILINYGVIGWSIIDAFFTLWPLILVAIGISIIFKNSATAKIVTWLAFIAILVSYSFFTTGIHDNNRPVEGKKIVVEKPSETKSAVIKVSMGGLKLNVDSTASRLVDAAIPGIGSKYSVNFNDSKDTAYVNIEQDRLYALHINTKDTPSVIRLNSDVVWNMDFKIGAVSGIIDVSGMKVSKMNIDIGASNLKLVFGKRSPNTAVKINAGASSFDLVFPKSAGIRIKCDGLLQTINFNNINFKKQNGYYTSPNYSGAESKFDVNASVGVGKLNVYLQD